MTIRSRIKSFCELEDNPSLEGLLVLPQAARLGPPWYPGASPAVPGPAQIEAIRGGLGTRDATLVTVLAYAGPRPGEALALRWASEAQGDDPESRFRPHPVWPTASPLTRASGQAAGAA